MPGDVRFLGREHPVHGLMMEQPLLVSSLLRHAERHHGGQEIVSARVEGDLHRYTYAEMAGRARRLANALTGLGVDRGDRVATLAWNGHRHLEVYFAVSGSGAVVHTVNPRLHDDQLTWILDDAGPAVLCFDATFLPLISRIAPRLATVRHFVLMTGPAHLPPAGTAGAGIPGLIDYESLLAAASPDFDWPVLDERTAAGLCYTSGTTGNPKGVLYSHRSTVLHTYGAALPDSLGITARDVVLVTVPMFHVNAWGVPYVAAMVGARQVLPGPDLSGPALHRLQEAEGVTVTGSVPTVWAGLLTHLRDEGRTPTTLRKGTVGGAACPPAMLRELEEVHGVEVIHGWGMTETSPLGTTGTLTSAHSSMTPEQRQEVKLRQGRVVYGLDMKIVDDDGAELEWDGATSGQLLVRGHWVLSEYYRRPDLEPLADGWFPTGDIATITPDGFMQITDRTKDVIKSGGEWISSVQIESLAMSHPAVALAACIGARHPKWDERPVLIVTRMPGADVTEAELRAHLKDHVASWWMPDAVVVVDEIPVGSTGKVVKTSLREQYVDLLLTR